GVMDGTLYLRIGSTGGAGAKVFTQVGGVPLSAEVLYFSRTTPRVLVGYDLIEQSPENGSLTVRRHLVSEDFGTLVPTPPSPSPSESPSASEAPALSPTGSASVYGAGATIPKRPPKRRTRRRIPTSPRPWA